jgi:hypothetical protein
VARQHDLLVQLHSQVLVQAQHLGGLADRPLRPAAGRCLLAGLPACPPFPRRVVEA